MNRNKIYLLTSLIIILSLTFISAYACNSNQDCNDLNLYTKDQCINPGTDSSHCSYTPINCVTNNDCNFTGFFGDEFCQENLIFKTYKNSICMNPGTTESYCNVTDTPKMIIDCGNNSCDNFGSNYCKGNSVYHGRWCYTRSCSNGSCLANQYKDEQLIQTCQNTCSNNQCDNGNNENIFCCQNSDCGINGLIGNAVCQNNNVFQNFITFTCINPGTNSSYCINSTSSEQTQTCSYNQVCLNSQCVTSNTTTVCCRSGAVVPNPIYQYNFTSTEECSVPVGMVGITKTIVDNSYCNNNNNNNTSPCMIDSDCGCSRSILVCNGDDVQNITTNPKCINNLCQDQTSTNILRTCKYHCSDGACTGNRASSSSERQTESDYIYNYNSNYTFPDSLNMPDTPITIQTTQTTNTNQDQGSAILIILALILIFMLVILLVVSIIQR